jgi:hypothetical protein
VTKVLKVHKEKKAIKETLGLKAIEVNKVQRVTPEPQVKLVKYLMLRK